MGGKPVPALNSEAHAQHSLSCATPTLLFSICLPYFLLIEMKGVSSSGKGGAVVGGNHSRAVPQGELIQDAVSSASSLSLYQNLKYIFQVVLDLIHTRLYSSSCG